MFPRLTKLGLCHSLFGDPPKESFFFYYHIGFEMWWKTLKNVKLSENAYLIKCGAIHAQKMSHNGLWAIAHVSNGTNSQDDERTDLIFKSKITLKTDVLPYLMLVCSKGKGKGERGVGRVLDGPKANSWLNKGHV